MLSEKLIDEWIQTIQSRYEEVNQYVLAKIARRIREFRDVLPSQVYSLERMLKTGSDVRDINKKLAEVTATQEAEIKRLIREIAVSAYTDAKPYYDYRMLPYIPFNENIALQRVVRTIADITGSSCRNLSNSTAYMIRDMRTGLLRPTPIAQTYQTAIDRAIQASQSGAVDYSTAIRETMKELVDSGIRHVEYTSENGKITTQRLDSAVRRNVLDGVRAINQGVQDIVGEQYGADGKEITVHDNPAPDHEDIQGHLFTNEEFEKLQNEQDFRDVNGRQYAGIRRAIGTWNCRHFTFSIIVGFSTPTHTQAELDEIIRKNHTGYTMANGKHLTMYECTQQQRLYERNIRKNKEGVMMAREAGDMELARQYQTKVDKLTLQYKQFTKACGLEVMQKKMAVPGFRRTAV